jgi:glucose-1-phosphate thymidylyltransferase
MITWGVVPAAGAGSRIQPLAFSKELLPVGSRTEGGIERPKAVSEYLIERLVLGGAKRICMVIGPGKSDILEYYGASALGADLVYVVQSRPAGLCDAIFRSLPLIQPDDQVLVGLPDTVWFPAEGLATLPDDALSFLLFSVEMPQLFDSVIADEAGNVSAIEVKTSSPKTSWVWGAFKLQGRILAELFELFCRRNRADAYLGTLVNAYLEEGGRARAFRAGDAYVDVGTLNGYRQAQKLLQLRK